MYQQSCFITLRLRSERYIHSLVNDFINSSNEVSIEYRYIYLWIPVPLYIYVHQSARDHENQYYKYPEYAAFVYNTLWLYNVHTSIYAFERTHRQNSLVHVVQIKKVSKNTNVTLNIYDCHIKSHHRLTNMCMSFKTLETQSWCFLLPILLVIQKHSNSTVVFLL